MLVSEKVKKPIHGRHGARWVAVQALYAWAMTGRPIAQIALDFTEEQAEFASEAVTFDTLYMHELLQGVTMQANVLDEIMMPYLDRPLAEVSPVEHAILRLAVYELKEKRDTPYRVVLNEAILLAKAFGATDSHKFVNSILDRVAREQTI